MKKVLIGTRGSRLALVQAHEIARRLGELAPNLELVVEIVRTKGDIIQDVPLSQVKGQGFFVKELESALSKGEVDLAVHSAKDLPTKLAEGLYLSAITKREDARDCLVSRNGASLDELPEGAVVGTSSLRRQAMLAHRRPDLRIRELRGNVDTRLRKLDDGQYDALIVARAALVRLDRADRISENLPLDIFVPAVAQGALAIESREVDTELGELISGLDDDLTHAAVVAERTLLADVQGGCQIPLGGHCSIKDGKLALRACAVTPDGSRRVAIEVEGTIDHPVKLGQQAATELLDRGGRAILDVVRLG